MVSDGEAGSSRPDAFGKAVKALLAQRGRLLRPKVRARSRTGWVGGKSTAVERLAVIEKAFQREKNTKNVIFCTFANVFATRFSRTS